MSRFMRFIITLTVTIQIPFVVAVAEASRRFLGVDTAHAWILGGVLGALGLFFFFGRAQSIVHDEQRPWQRTFLVDLPYWVHWCTCLYCLIPALLYVILAPLSDLVRGLPVSLSPGFFMWTYASGLLVCGWGVTLRRWWFLTRRVEVRVRGLDKKFDGYTIAHLSDLHIGNLTPLWWGQRWARATNSENADMVVITGDMVTSGVNFHREIAQLVGELRGKDGVFVAMGNHDYFGEGEPLISLIREQGAKVLRNEGVVLERDGGQLYLAAIDDTWTRRADMDQALAERPSGAPTVLLAHDPDRFPEAVKRGVGLVLSGHTHGGQIAVPFIARHINASKLAHHYHLGVYEDGDSTLYVHPGLGTTGPPMRLGVAPALVMLTLRSA